MYYFVRFFFTHHLLSDVGIMNPTVLVCLDENQKQSTMWRVKESKV